MQEQREQEQRKMDASGAALLNVTWRTEPNFIEAVSRKN
jgi:hypothetical protein